MKRCRAARGRQAKSNEFGGCCITELGICDCPTCHETRQLDNSSTTSANRTMVSPESELQEQCGHRPLRHSCYFSYATISNEMHETQITEGILEDETSQQDVYHTLVPYAHKSCLNALGVENRLRSRQIDSPGPRCVDIVTPAV